MAKKRTDFNYYSGFQGDTANDGLTEGLGYYRYATFKEVIDNWIALNVGEDQLFTKISRNKVVGHAKRGIQQFTYDILRTEKAQVIDLRADTLSMPLPQDYVNIIKVSFIDLAGVEHTLQPARDVNPAVDISQNEDGSYLYREDGSLLEITPAANITRFQDPSSDLTTSALQGYIYGQYNDDEYSQFSPYSYSRRYGLDPEKENVNGQYVIDHNAGIIYFSSHFANNTDGEGEDTKIKLDYVSDGLADGESEIQVNKLAEEALYKWIEYALVSRRMPREPEYVVRRIKKERDAEMRNAKHRMKSYNLTEIAQVMRGQSKWIKH